MISLTIALSLALAALPTPRCDHNRALLKLGYEALDETVHQGWRTVADRPACLSAAADLIAEYRRANASELVENAPDHLRSLDWHEGQLRAAAGQTDRAIALMERGSRPDDAGGDGLYQRATVAFLRKDRTALLRLSQATSALPRPSWLEEAAQEARRRGLTIPPWPVHGAEIAAFIACFDHPYADAYYGRCTPKPSVANDGASPATAAKLTRMTRLRADGSTFSVSIFDRGVGIADQALLVIAGSDCKDFASRAWADQVLDGAATRWVVSVDKDGASKAGRCAAGYEAHSVEESRWFDHMAAMDALKRQLKLRDRWAFQVMAVSAGGLTACAVAGATQDVSALTLLGTGGGMTFSEELAELTANDVKLASEKERVATRPQIGRTWMGSDNPEIWWWSALPKKCEPLLGPYGGRLLVVHGDEDRSVPVRSATALIENLRRDHKSVDFTEMHSGHDLGLSGGSPGENGFAKALKWLRAGADDEPLRRP